jgi:hypothetical protein
VYPTDAVHPTDGPATDTSPRDATPADHVPTNDGPAKPGPLSQARARAAAPERDRFERTDNRFGSRVESHLDNRFADEHHDMSDEVEAEPAPFAAMRAKAEARSAGLLGPLQRRVAPIPAAHSSPRRTDGATAHQYDFSEQIRSAEQGERRFARIAAVVILVLVALFGVRQVLGSQKSVTAATPVSELPWRTADGPAARWRAEVPTKASVVTTSWSVDGSAMTRSTYTVPGAATEIWAIDTDQSAAGVAGSIIDVTGATLESSTSVDQDWGAAVSLVATNNERTTLLWAGSIDGAVVVVRVYGLDDTTLARGQAIFDRITTTFRPI